MPLTPINGTRYPSLGSATNVPQDLQNLALDVDDNLVPRYLTSAARDAAITAPVGGMVCTVNGDLQLRRGFWDPIALQPQSADRTTNVVNLAVPAAGTASPPGVGLTLPALPVGHRVVVFLSTDFYVEGSGAPQSLNADIAPNGASKIGGSANGAMSMSGLTTTVHTRQTFNITQATSATFGSTYATGAGTQRAVLIRENWTVIL